MFNLYVISNVILRLNKVKIFSDKLVTRNSKDVKDDI